MASKINKFRFAVIADTHVIPHEGRSFSFWESHRMTNDRLRQSVPVLNALDPAFVIHVGDMVHPVPESAVYADAAVQFKQIMSELKAPLHLVAGNHDSGDKPADYVPAGVIRDDFVAKYEQHLGPHYYSFDAGGCHFVVINTSLLNSGLDAEAQQAKWLERDLQAHRGKRTLLFVHYPPFVATPDEPGHYDNIDPPARGWLLGLIEKYSIEGVFAGHVHNFFFNRLGECNFYLMPSTSFVRSDYAEVFSVEPASDSEGGRSDPFKLGVMVVDVMPNGISTQFLRTTGARQPDGTVMLERDWPKLNPAAGPLPTLGIDMREGWTQLYEVPYSSMIDEFGRKRARNDYRVLALWGMGVRTLRVPLQDLLDDAARARVQAMASVGMRFVVFSFGMPPPAALTVLKRYRDVLAGFEVILGWPIADEAWDAVGALHAQLGVPVSVSRFWNAAGQSQDGKQVKLFVDHGFTPDDPRLHELERRAQGIPCQRLVFRVSRSSAAAEAIATAVQAAERAGLTAQIHVRLAGDEPAIPQDDERRSACRVLEAAMSSFFYREHEIILDTLSDVDRGYFQRVGLIDRRANPRLGAQVLRNLNGALSELPPLDTLQWHRTSGSLVGLARAGGYRVALVLPQSHAEEAADTSALQASAARALRRLDLETAVEETLDTPWMQALDSLVSSGRFALLVGSDDQPIEPA